jgi:hypothetical protein
MFLTLPRASASFRTMSRRGRGMSSWEIDAKYPHQVALPNSVTVARFNEIQATTERMSKSPLGHGFFRNGDSYVVYCFSEAEHAQRIAEAFGGELMCPDTRPRWPAKPSRKEMRERRNR